MKKKQLAILTLSLLTLSLLASAQQTKSTVGENLPYEASYSSHYSVSSTKNILIVENVLKQWEDNKFNLENILSDSIRVELPNGLYCVGKDRVIKMFKAGRSVLLSSKVSIKTVLAVKSDKGQEWVMLWGGQNNEATNGTKGTLELQQNWKINADGKIDFMKQYEAAPTK